MRTMYDSITAADIPTTVAMVAGYCDLNSRWSAADWDRFPGAVKVRIARSALTNDGHVLDVERFLASPEQAPGWVAMRRAAGADPTVYCNAAALGTVQAAFDAAGVAWPHFWVAHYDGVPAVPSGCVAKQYINDPASGGHWDLSAVADYWPGVDPAPTNGGAAAPTTGELMERITVTPPNAGVNPIRVKLSGTPSAAVIVRPPLNGDGTSPTMWVGNIFAWGSDKTGVGHNPKSDPAYVDRMDHGPRRFELPGAVWADIEYSAHPENPFEIDQF